MINMYYNIHINELLNTIFFFLSPPLQEEKKKKKKMVSFLVWFLCFNGISTLFRLFNAKAILLEEQ